MFTVIYELYKASFRESEKIILSWLKS